MLIQSDIEEVQLDFNDVLLRPQRNKIRSRIEVSVIEDFNIKEHKITILPLIASNMNGVSTLQMHRELNNFKALTCLHKYIDYNILDQELTDKDSPVSVAIGMDVDLDKFTKLIDSKQCIKFIICDTANGYNEYFLDFVEKISNRFKSHIIVAGNIVCPIGLRDLYNAGADVIKIGIGASLTCTTRLVTGFGWPQLSALKNCVQEAQIINAQHNRKCYTMLDGGCKTTSDIIKGYAAGADIIMLGSMLAGCIEGGNIIEPGIVNVSFSGNASFESMQKHNKLADHRAIEGRTISVGYKGSVSNVVNEIINGIRSGCSYCGAKSIRELYHKTRFIRVNRQTNHEN